MREDSVPIHPGARRLTALEAPASPRSVDALRRAAAPLRGLRVLHLTGPPFTTGAVDQLSSTVPYLRELGLDAHWRALTGADGTQATARQLQDGLRGGETALGAADLAAWRDVRADLRAADVVIVHDAAALAALAGDGDGDGGGGRPPAGRVAWWVHGEASSPEAAAWDALRPLAARAGTIVVDHPSFAPPTGPGQVLATIAPAVDPLAARHLELPPRVTGAFARTAGLDLNRPTLAVVATLDAWAFPEEAVDAWRHARGAGPSASRELQLALVARVAHGDERAWRALGELHEHVAALDGCVVIADVAGHGDGAANAAQRLARVVLQDGRDGYGIAAAEALWKGTPVVAARTPALAEQIADGHSGFLTDSVAERGARVAELVADPGYAAGLARAGREHVRERLLVTRQLADELALLERLSAGALS